MLDALYIGSIRFDTSNNNKFSTYIAHSKAYLNGLYNKDKNIKT